MKTKLLFFTFFAFCLSLFSQTNFVVTGFVNNNNKDPLHNVSLHFKNENKHFEVFTDSSGLYTIKLPASKYELIISHEDFVTIEGLVDLKKNSNFNFVLSSKFEQLSEITIPKESKKTFKEYKPNVLDFNPKDLKILPSMMGTVDIVKFLQLTPGVQNSGDANGYFYVRGSDPGHNLTLYSDSPIYGTAHLLGIFPFFNADHIQNVHFDKNNSNPKNGGRLSASVSIETNHEMPKEASLNGTVGLLASQLTLAVPLAHKLGLYISGRRTYIDEIIAPLFSKKKNTENSDVKDLKYGFSDLNYTLVANPNTRNQFVLDGFWSSDKLSVKDVELGLETDLLWTNISVSSSWKYQFSPSVKMKNTLYLSRYNNDLFFKQASVEINGISKIQDFGFLNSFKYTVLNVPLESGIQYANYELQPQKVDVSNLSLETVANASEINKVQNFSVFTSAKPQFTKSISAEIGLRLNRYFSDNKEVDYLHLEPRIQINYAPDDTKSVFVSYTNQHQYLNLITTSSVGIPTDFWVASGKGVPAQSSNEYSLGGKYRFYSQFIMNSSLYYRSMKNLLEYPFGITQFNEISSFAEDIKIGKGEAYGLEWMFQKEKGKLKGWISYTLSWSTRKFDEINQGKMYFAKYDRRHNLAVVGTYSINSKFDFGVTQTVSSGNRFTLPKSWYFINNNPVKQYGDHNNAQLPTYFRTDFSFNYYFIKSLKKESAINFSVFNIFNIRNPIYMVLNVDIDDVKQKAEVNQDGKELYSIVPSLSWRFKF